MAIDLAVMRKRLEEKQAEIQQHIATLTGSPAQPEDAIQASDGVEESEEEAVDLEESDVEQAILNNEQALLVEVQQALARIDNGTFGPHAMYKLYFVDPKHLDVTVMADASYPAGTLNKFEIDMNEIRPNVYIVTWIEPKTGNTVTHIEDYEQGIAFTNITDMASKQFWRLKGKIRPVE